MSKPVLAIGDIHGHLDRLEALLVQEGIIGECGMCGTTGDVGDDEAPEFCPACDGTGLARINRDVTVVQLGDLGHFGGTSSPTADELCYKFGYQWFDYQLWGNHDRAVVDSWHHHAGYMAPGPAMKHLMKLRVDEGRLLLAYEAHGFLLTHAGLHGVFKHQKIDPLIKQEPERFAGWMNQLSNFDLEADSFDSEAQAIRDAISPRRGGRSPFGGILWRDAGESLYPNFRQVFGHSSKPKVRKYIARDGDSYCIDTGDKDNGMLNGIWLPSEEVVGVNLSVREI